MILAELFIGSDGILGLSVKNNLDDREKKQVLVKEMEDEKIFWLYTCFPIVFLLFYDILLIEVSALSGKFFQVCAVTGFGGK